MLNILQNEKVVNGLVILGFGLLAIGIAMNFQNKKTDKTEIIVGQTQRSAHTVMGVSQKAEPTEIEDKSKIVIKKEQTYESVPIGENKEKILDKININKASLAELDTLKGIGPAIGQRIIDYRKENHGKNRRAFKGTLK